MNISPIANDLVQAIEEYIECRSYCTNVVLATGQEVRHGADGYIEYLFNTDLKARPTLHEDGSVDFFWY